MPKGPFPKEVEGGVWISKNEFWELPVLTNQDKARRMLPNALNRCRRARHCMNYPEKYGPSGQYILKLQQVQLLRLRIMRETGVFPTSH
jgi:hypothetical protein